MCCISTSYASKPITEIVFFGDSLTDNGNLYRAVKFIPKSPPYYQGRFSNGPIWAEYVSDYYHDKYNIQTHNYAIGGTTVYLRNPLKGCLPYTLDEEITNYLVPNTFKNKSTTLFSIWMGGNDYMDEKEQNINSLTDEVVGGISYEISRLIFSGAKNFLILDLPDLSHVPFALKEDDAVKQRLADMAKMSHIKLTAVVEKYKKQYPDMRFVFIESYAALNDALSNPQKYNEKYHIHLTNMTQPCWIGGNTLRKNSNKFVRSESLAAANEVAQLHDDGVMPCSNPDEYAFWDSVHPTKVMHQLLAGIVEEGLSKTDMFTR
jgi:phospholipase/lecithinase/hemolysin